MKIEHLEYTADHGVNCYGESAIVGKKSPSNDSIMKTINELIDVVDELKKQIDDLLERLEQ